MMKRILVINGPNLNLLGEREPEIYGNRSIGDIEKLVKDAGTQLKYEIAFFQSNSEGAIIDMLQKSRKEYAGIIINPAAYTHTSVAIYDALKTVGIPVVEVHISNIYQREDFRKNSITAAAASGVISGFGHYSYILAVIALVNMLEGRGE